MSGVPIEHPIFGAMAWNAEEFCWEGRADLPPGPAVRVLFGYEEDEESLEEALAQADASWAWLRANEPAARLAVAAEFVADCNHFFTPTGFEETWDAAGVAGHLVLRRVRLYGGGVGLAYVDDGEFSISTFEADFDGDREIDSVEPLG